jgi:hypothetical protein
MKRLLILLLASLLPNYAGAAIGLSNSGTNTTPADPLVITVSAAANDFLIASISTDSSASPASLTLGSPLVQDYTATSAVVDGMRFHAASGRASGSISSVSVSGFGAGAFRGIGAIAVFTGVDTTTALDTAVVTAADGGAAANNTGNMIITPVTAGTMLVMTAAFDQSGTTDPTFSVNDNGAGLSWTYVTSYEPAGFRKTMIGYAIAPSAATYTLVGNFGLTGGFAAALYALRPATGGGGGSSIPAIFRHLRQMKQ